MLPDRATIALLEVLRQMILNWSLSILSAQRVCITELAIILALLRIACVVKIRVTATAYIRAISGLNLSSTLVRLYVLPLMANGIAICNKMNLN